MCANTKITSRVRRVGNSLAVVIPSEEAKAHQISEGDVVQIKIERRINLKDLFGTVKFSKSSQDMKNEDRRRGWVD